MLNEALPVLDLIHDTETILWREKERTRIRTVQMDNLKDCWVLGE